MKNIPPLFSDKNLQDEFHETGFVKVPLLAAEEADELVRLFNATREIHEQVKTPHHTTTDTQNLELIRDVDSRIKKIFAPALGKILKDYKPLVGCFHIKEAGVGSNTGIHQDPTFVDEENFVSANVWVALHDMNEQNGNMLFIPRSNKISCLRITPDSPNYYSGFYGSLAEMAVQVPMKKGEAVIFNNATIHAATDNLSNDLRLAATLLVCSSGADWLLYYKDKNTPHDRIEKYVLNFESFIGMPKSGRPDKKVFSEMVGYNFPSLSKAEFLQAIGKTKKTSYLQRFKNVLKEITA